MGRAPRVERRLLDAHWRPSLEADLKALEQVRPDLAPKLCKFRALGDAVCTSPE